MLTLTGLDGGAPWRGRYADENACLELLHREGGVLAVMGRGAALVGLPVTASPLRGDVGVIKVRTIRGEPLIGAICTGSKWAAMSARGLRLLRAEAVAAWSSQHVQ